MSSRYGEAGQSWLLNLPEVIASRCEAWDLRPAGPIRHGNCAVVIPVDRPAGSAALKVSWVDGKTRHESAALAQWKGSGAVRLLDVDACSGSLLLELLDADRTLEGIEIDAAVAMAAKLLRRLAIPAGGGIPLLSAQAVSLAADLKLLWQDVGQSSIPQYWLDAALDACAQLGSSSAQLIVNHDLHYGNVLAGEREQWLVIDPKVVIGDPEFGVAPLLWNRFADLDGPAALRRRFDMVIDNAALDHQRAVSWSVFRVVDYWLWSLRDGSDVPACADLTRWLVSLAR
ncbi:aminoglycoside phosphotransferase family protein [Rhodococcus sp. 05-2255-3C]|nr:aminoglycoside phosphotransferase family protein [Rhodococcus sp. 05-2255-3C]